ncbi:PAN domain-containing protein [Phaeobacter inhibens]|uniref:PAN domain-containing protein n=1 Tax=Phaeobacter inhibens TaxID=221822 RepID=UPI00295E8595|nr:PAN domain-containing protein [Phaeobacter inhibens]
MIIYRKTFTALRGLVLGRAKIPNRKAAVALLVWVISFGLSAVPATACGFGSQPKSGVYGGYDFYYGLIHQRDPETGKTLDANRAVSVSSPGECAQVCANDTGCTAVTFSITPSRRCHLFAAFDFETNRYMGLRIIHLGETSTSSAIIRTGFQGSLCR